MTQTSLKDILDTKKSGDVYYSLAAPENVRRWTLEYKWPEDLLSSNGLGVLSVNVTGGKEMGNQSKRWDQKNPMILKSGVTVSKGFFKTHTVSSCSFSVRVDSIIELNEVLTELATLYDFTSFEIKNLEVYNKEKGTRIEFQIHNPNHEGNRLSTWRFTDSEKDRLYPHVTLHEQLDLLSQFHEGTTQCTLKEVTVLEKQCAYKMGVKGSQIRLRKN